MSRRYWWANQTRNYDAEIAEGRLWAAANRHGTMIASRRPILESRPGTSSSITAERLFEP